MLHSGIGPVLCVIALGTSVSLAIPILKIVNYCGWPSSRWCIKILPIVKVTGIINTISVGIFDAIGNPISILVVSRANIPIFVIEPVPVVVSPKIHPVLIVL